MGESIMNILMLLPISCVSTEKNSDEKQTPLYRTRQAISEKVGLMIENIRADCLVEKMFFLSFSLLTNRAGSHTKNS